MATCLPICDKLADVAKSRLVKDMMLVHYWEEVKDTVRDESDLRAKASELSARVDHRVKTIEELLLLFGSDSSLKTIDDMKRMNTEDLCNVARLLLVASQKRVRIRDLVAFIDKLEMMEH